MVLTQEEKAEQIKYWRVRIGILKECSDDIVSLLSELEESVLGVESIPCIEGKVEIPDELVKRESRRLENGVQKLQRIKRNLKLL